MFTTDRNWKFEKFVSTKIQTDELKRIEAASADNVIMLVDATVLWKISDVETAVRMSAETMSSDGTKTSQTIVKLRNDVLKQAEASLAFFVGTINFSDSMAAAAVNQRTKSNSAPLPIATAETFAGCATQGADQFGVSAPAARAEEFNLYNNERLDDAVSHANEITKTYGVKIIAINIISAIPKSQELQASLAKGAVAAAEAQMMETTAKGKSRAINIEAKAKAEQIMILAKANADADIIQAEGARKAADMLAENPVSVELAKIERTGEALAAGGNNSTFFFGADAHSIQGLLANSAIVK
jgi:regulator of protease activity HflC (stomatin/prohibitin superfamily)